MFEKVDEKIAEQTLESLRLYLNTIATNKILQRLF